MADDTGVAEDDGEVGEDDDAEESPSKGRRSPGDRAGAYLRSARRGLRDVSDPSAKAQFLVAEAEVLALLDVAAALRGDDGGAEAE